MKEKRTVSDNTRPIFEQTKAMILQNNQQLAQGMKVVLDKSQIMNNS